jgi:D-alanyl-D-alanine carboxypeptidase/D-alanyl-D-alanine-endopeptidase (penicillin-binding protein 4)
MRRVLPPALVVLCLWGLPQAAFTAETTQEGVANRLGARVRRVVDAAGIPEDELGIAVLLSGEQPEHVYTRGAARALVPASVAKVLTGAAALDLLGPAYRFRTSVSARGALAEGVLAGDLVVHGSGDPNLSGRLGGGVPTQVLDALARQVRDAGVREVQGALVLDDGAFDREYTHPGWMASDKERWYGAPVAGLVFNDSCVEVSVDPAGRADQRAELAFPSTSGVWGVENLTTTLETGRPSVYATWTTSGRALQVRGSVPLRSQTTTIQVPVPDPLAFFGGALRRSLERAGVRVSGGLRPARDAADRAPGRLVAQHASGMQDTLRVMNRRSQNLYASLLFKACGAAHGGLGSWESGEEAVREMLRRRGIPEPQSTSIVDGSGLARDNRTSAATLVLLLVDFERDLLRGPLLHDSLAAPGEEGTLDRRLLSRHTKGRLRAKTGTLAQSGVYSMAGTLEGAPGRPPVCFAILVNKRTWRGDARALIDDVVESLARP